MVYQEEMAEMELQGEMVRWVDMGLLDLRDKREIQEKLAA